MKSLAIITLWAMTAFISGTYAQNTQTLKETQLTVTSNKTMSVEQSSMTMADAIVVNDAWARATFALAKTGAAYMFISNPSEQNVHLLSVDVDERTAMFAQLHHTVMNNDMMQMQELSEGLVIEEKQTLSFEPGGKHIMLMGLTGPLEPNQNFTVYLNFADESVKEVVFVVKDARTKR